MRIDLGLEFLRFHHTTSTSDSERTWVYDCVSVRLKRQMPKPKRRTDCAERGKERESGRETENKETKSKRQSS